MIFQIGAALTLQSSSLTLVFDWPVCFFSGMRLILIKWSTKVQVRQGKNHKTSWFLDVPKPKTFKKWLKYLKLNIQYIMAIISMEHYILYQRPSMAGSHFPPSFSDPMCHSDPGGCVRLVAALKSDKMNLIPWRCLDPVDPVGWSDFFRRSWEKLGIKDKLVSWKHFGRFMQSFKLMFFFEF